MKDVLDLFQNFKQRNDNGICFLETVSGIIDNFFFNLKNFNSNSTRGLEHSTFINV